MLAALPEVTTGVRAAQRPAPSAETVVVTFQAKPGPEAVHDSPHPTLRRVEEGNKVCFTEIFT